MTNFKIPLATESSNNPKARSRIDGDEVCKWVAKWAKTSSWGNEGANL